MIATYKTSMQQQQQQQQYFSGLKGESYIFTIAAQYQALGTRY